MKSDKDRQMSKREQLTQTPVPKLIITLAIPTIISMLVTGFYNMADTFFVGRVSTEATAAVGLVFPVMALIQAFGFFFGQGSGTFLSRMLGAGNSKEANEMAVSGFVVSLAAGVVCAIVGNVFADPLAVAIGASDTTMADTMDYMRIILIGAPFMMGQFVLNNQLRFQGSAMYSMAGLMCGAVVNVALDPLLILALDLGTAGAAIATVSGQVISFLVLMAGSRHGENIRLELKNIRINGHYLYEILNGGLPSLFRQGLAAVATLLLNHAAKSFGGAAAVAGMSVASRALMMIASAMIGFGQGFQPVCAYNYGAGLTGRVKEGFLFCVKYGAIFLTVFSAIMFVFAPEVIVFFRDDADVAAVGQVALRAQCVSMPLLSFTTMTNMMLQSSGKGLKASILASARSGIFFIPAILIMPLFMGVLGVEFAQAVADFCAFSLSIPLAYSELKKM